MKLGVGETECVSIRAGAKWNDTGFDVAAGESYEFRAAGEWVDWIIRTDANGYESSEGYLKPLERFRRAPQQRWFALIGAVNRRKENQFLIGIDRKAKMRAAGRLYCFANDIPLLYWNNKGVVELKIRRLT
jgi:hypothetical protein